MRGLRPTRRSVLSGLIAALLAPRASLAAAPATPAAGFHIVDGWVLTSADLEALARHDP